MVGERDRELKEVAVRLEPPNRAPNMAACGLAGRTLPGIALSHAVEIGAPSVQLAAYTRASCL